MDAIQYASRAEKHAAIDRELLADPARSDSEISRIVGCDHKTVGGRRKELDPAPPTATEFRKMLVCGAEDFISKNPLPTAEEAVDDALAKGIVQRPGHELGSDADDFDWNVDDSVILREQRATAAYRNRNGELIIRQRAGWNDDGDTFIFVSPENEVTFMEALAKRARE